MSNKKSGIENQKAVRLNDGFGTIIYIGKNENPEKAIAKYLKDLKEYEDSGLKSFSRGREKPLRR
jgi:hypothetical protein